MVKVVIDAVPNKTHSEVHIALDFDGTLAHYESWEKQGNKVGPPIKRMVEQVKKWLDKDYKVSIFTARLSHSGPESQEQIVLIQEFLRKNGLPDTLPITCIKAHWFTHFVDDRAYHVVPNSGVILENLNL